MIRRTIFLALPLVFLTLPAHAGPTGVFSSPSPPGCIPPPGGKCLTQEEIEEVTKAIEELDSIHKSQVVMTTDDKVVIIQDWQGRVYTNGGATNPIKFKFKLGPTVDRELAMTLPTQIYYRPQPPDPMFRIRIRAQAGILVPQLIQTLRGNKQGMFDGSIGLDFFHIGIINASVYTGIRSVGAGPGIDLTKNFGITAGYAMIYDGFQSSIFTSAYFSFN